MFKVISKVNDQMVMELSACLIETMENFILDAIEEKGIPRDGSSPIDGEDYYALEDQIKEFIVNKVIVENILYEKR